MSEFAGRAEGFRRQIGMLSEPSASLKVVFGPYRVACPRLARVGSPQRGTGPQGNLWNSSALLRKT